MSSLAEAVASRGQSEVALGVRPLLTRFCSLVLLWSLSWLSPRTNARSSHQAHQNIQLTLQTLKDHGFLVNLKNSHLQPTTRLTHLEADTSLEQVFLSLERQVSIHDLISFIRNQQTVPLIQLSQPLGKMVSAFHIVPWSRFHSGQLQWLLLPYQKANCSCSTNRIRLTSEVRRSLCWWLSPAVTQGSLFREPPCITLTTEASLQGWGAHILSHMAQGLWSCSDQRNSINWLELKAVFLALLQFHSLVANAHVLVLTATKAHINRQGETKSRRLMTLYLQLISWAETHLLSLRAKHISGVQNIQADGLSHMHIDPAEWSLHRRIFQQLTVRFGLPVLDLFASQDNTQLPRYFTRYATPGVEGTDALRSEWPLGLLYAFPPTPLIQRVVQKLLN
ncbi:PREDICTED: uncharacterized protein LOC106538525 [Thamnophis sirtalis]|uniref:Uncharacterized protein LOC106538525 n=1 Tax=Thamnophis sirtalis TaxID=35019 RepID=A0A6I9WZU6_9SAUR|nr:PREDICTED: uncharacterized protein LOC106538525 [Thamnophis sirtalis]